MSTKTEVVWETPPERRAEGQRAWRPIAEALRQRPGEWARVAEVSSQSSATSTATNIKRGRYAGLAAGEYESRSVTRKGGPHYVYARYVGKSVRAVAS